MFFLFFFWFSSILLSYRHSCFFHKDSHLHKPSMMGLSHVSYRKKYRSNARATTTTAKSNSNVTTTTTSTAKAVGKNLRESLKTKLMTLGNDFLLQRLPSVMKKQRCQRRRKLKEEEQAAVRLMALSCGSVFA